MQPSRKRSILIRFTSCQSGWSNVWNDAEEKRNTSQTSVWFFFANFGQAKFSVLAYVEAKCFTQGERVEVGYKVFTSNNRVKRTTFLSLSPLFGWISNRSSFVFAVFFFFFFLGSPSTPFLYRNALLLLTALCLSPLWTTQNIPLKNLKPPSLLISGSSLFKFLLSVFFSALPVFPNGHQQPPRMPRCFCGPHQQPSICPSLSPPLHLLPLTQSL